MSEEQAPMDFYDGNGKLLFRMDASQPLGVHDLRLPGAIHFNAGNTVEVMRLSRDGVWVNPDIKPDEVAQAVLNAIDANIKVLVQRAVEDEREACAYRAGIALLGADRGLADRVDRAIRGSK